MPTGSHNPLTLNGDRSVRAGSFAALADAVRRGADLRIATAFRHNEHIDTGSGSAELIEEVAEFRVTYLLPQPRLGSRLAHGPQRRPCGALALRPVHPRLHQKRGALRHPLVCRVG